MNILAVGAHFDDIELGCAGTLIKHVKNADNVTILVAADSSYASPDNRVIRKKETAQKEGQKAAGIIGAHLAGLDLQTFHVHFDEALTAGILKHIENLEIDTLYAPWIHDVHRDHQNAGKAALMAGRHLPRCLMYQTNWYTSRQMFKKQIFSDITAEFDRKLEAIRAHESENARTQGSWIEFVEHDNRVDGLRMGVTYAESFEIIRYLI